MATGRAGYVRPVSGGRPGPVVTQGGGHLGESAAGSGKTASVNNRGRFQASQAVGKPAGTGPRGCGRSPHDGGWTHGHFLPSRPGGGSCVLRVCWHDSGGWPGYTPERGEGDWLATTRWGAAWPITIRSAYGECADRLQAGAAHTGRFYGPAGSACGLAGLGQGHLLTLMCAPAGYGKTTLLAQWCQAQAGGSFAWVTLDKGDSDPVRFWTYLICAIAGIEPAVGQTSLQALSPQPDRLIGEALPRLLSELDEETREIALVLDDFQLCENDEVAGSLGFFVEHKPARVQVVASCRSDPRLPVGRFRANGQLLEIRAEDLRFDDREAEAFFTLAGIGGLSCGDITTSRAVP